MSSNLDKLRRHQTRVNELIESDRRLVQEDTMDVLDMAMDLSLSKMHISGKETAADVTRPPSPHQLSIDADLEHPTNNAYNINTACNINNGGGISEENISQTHDGACCCPPEVPSQEDIEMEEAELEEEHEDMIETDPDYNHFEWFGNHDGVWYKGNTVQEFDQHLERLMQRKENVSDDKIDHQNY